MAHSVRKPKPSLLIVAWPEYPRSKNRATSSSIRSLMRPRKDSPTSMFLPETRNPMAPSTQQSSASQARAALRLIRADQGLFLTSALDRRRNSHRLPVFRYSPAGNVDPRPTQFVDN